MTVVKLVDETISKEIRERLNIAIGMHDDIPKNHGRTAAVATLLGEGHQTVRLWLADGVSKKAGLPNLSRISNVAKSLGINIAWLIEGTGPMLRKDSKNGDSVSANLLSEMWQVARKELPDINMDELDADIRGTVLLHIYELISLHSYKTASERTPENAEMYQFMLQSTKKLVKPKL